MELGSEREGGSALEPVLGTNTLSGLQGQEAAGWGARELHGRGMEGTAVPQHWWGRQEAGTALPGMDAHSAHPRPRSYTLIEPL